MKVKTTQELLLGLYELIIELQYDTIHQYNIMTTEERWNKECEMEGYLEALGDRVPEKYWKLIEEEVIY